MSTSPPAPRPSSRSERLLRDTLRRDDTLRTHTAHARSASSTCDDDDDDDDDFFQSAILYRCSRRNSAASALGHGHSNGFYVPDENEHASYSRLLRSSSCSGSSRSGRSDRNPSPRRAYTHEKQEDLSRHHDAPHEAVLRSRLDSVMHSMRIDRPRDPVDALTHAQSHTASLPSSLGSLSLSHTHSHESHQTHITVPDLSPSLPLSPRPKRTSSRGHRHSHSASVPLPTSPQRTGSSPRVPQSPRSPRAPQGLRSPPRTPTSHEKEQLKRLHPDSPWMYAPLPPSPPAFAASPSKHGGHAVVTFVASPPVVDAHAHISTRSTPRHSPNSSSTFDPDAASHALRQLPGYVSFASVAGLGAPPEEEDRRVARKPFAGFALGSGKGRLSGLGLGNGGKWWMF